MVMCRGLLCLLAAASLATAAELPAGTQLHIRLATGLNSASAKPKQPVEAVVIAPVLAGEQIAIGQGTKVEGKIKEVTQPEKADQQAIVTLQFDQLKGKTARAPIDARVVSVDNARESVDDKGRILGIIAAETGSARLDQGINKIAQRFPGLADMLGAAKGAVVKEADPSIVYEPGTEMTIELMKPLKWNDAAAAPNIRAIEPASELAAMVDQQPLQTMAQSPRRPSDITNLLFLGTENELVDAFTSAGWSTAEALNGKSKLETFRAIVELRGYKEAPVSILMLDGRPPDMVFQKQNNTFAQRHHLRIWRRPGTFDGKAIWVCSATHDIGIDFSQRDYTFIHKVDPRIDDERAKVVNDLLFTGKVKALALVDRPNAPTSGENATGDAFTTDGRMAVLEF